jgi:hypothetical protein
VSILGDIAGAFGLGGSSSSASVSSTVNLAIQGLDKIGITETIDLKPIEIKPLALTLNESIDLGPVEIKPLTLTLNENIDLKPVEIKPLTLNENIDLKPVTLNENIDLKPVAIDSCQTLRIAPLPDTRICNPYHHRVAYSLFGLEIMGVSYHGETEQNIESPRRPQVVERPGRIEHHRPASPTVLGGNRGIRVRVLDPNDE